MPSFWDNCLEKFENIHKCFTALDFLESNKIFAYLEKLHVRKPILRFAYAHLDLGWLISLSPSSHGNEQNLLCCLFVCLGIFVLLENYSIIWRHNHYRWRAANVDLYSALMAIQKWGVFNVQHLYSYTGHPLIMAISKDLWHSYLLPIFFSGAVITCFNDFGLS